MFSLFVILLYFGAYSSRYEDMGVYDLLVAGGGGAGLSAISFALHNGFERVGLVEKLDKLGGSLRTIDMGENGQYKVPHGFHTYYRDPVNMPGFEVGFDYTIGDISYGWEPLDPESNYFVFQDMETGYQRHSLLKGGFMVTVIPDGARRTEEDVLCINRDTSISRWSDDTTGCTEDEATIQNSGFSRYVIENKKSKFFEALGIPYEEEEKRRNVEDQVIVVPWYALFLTMQYPDQEPEIWNYMGYQFAILEGQIPADCSVSGADKVDEFISPSSDGSESLRNIFKMPLAALAAADVNTVCHDAGFWVSFYMYIVIPENGVFFRGGMDAIIERFEETIGIYPDAEIHLNTEITKYIVDYYPGEQTDDCPTFFHHKVCKKRCDEGDISCIQECDATKVLCGGRYKVGGFITKDRKRFWSDRIISTMTLEVDKDLLPLRLKMDYDYSSFNDVIKPSTHWHKLYCVVDLDEFVFADGSPLPNADMYFNFNPLENFQQGVADVRDMWWYDDSVPIPTGVFINSHRDSLFMEEHEGKGWFTYVEQTPKTIWKVFQYFDEDNYIYQWFKSRYNEDMKARLSSILPNLKYELCEFESPLDMERIMGHGLEHGVLSYQQNTPEEGGFNKTHRPGVENLLIAGANADGPGITVVSGSGVGTVAGMIG